MLHLERIAPNNVHLIVILKFRMRRNFDLGVCDADLYSSLF